MNAQTEHNPNRITSRCLFSKPVSSMDWSLASNESIYSLHKGNVSRSREHGLIALKLNEFQKSNELVNKTETNSVRESLDTDKSDELVNQITETNLVKESLDTKNDEDEEKEEKEDDVKEIITDDSNEPVNQIIAPPLLPVKEVQDTEISDSDDEEKELEDDVKEIIADHSSICCRSDTSNNSFSSFSFPILHCEDGSVRRPYFERSWNVSDKRLEMSREETQTRPQGPQPQFYFIPASQMLTHLPPPQNSLSKQVTQTQSQKAFRNRWFSCFYGSSQDD